MVVTMSNGVQLGKLKMILGSGESLWGTMKTTKRIKVDVSEMENV